MTKLQKFFLTPLFIVSVPVDYVLLNVTGRRITFRTLIKAYKELYRGNKYTALETLNGGSK